MSDQRTISNVITFAVDQAVSGNFTPYEGMDRKERASVRKAVKSAFEASVRKGDLSTGQRLLAVQDALSKMSAKSASPEMSPAEQIGQRVSNLLEAARTMTTGTAAPEGMDPINLADSGMSFEEVISDNGDISYIFTVSADSTLPGPIDAMATKIANVKITRKTKENDIPALIRVVFADVEIGTFMKVGDIRKKLAQTYPDKGITSEWEGRLSAALFGKKGVDGVEGVNKDHSAYFAHGSLNGGIKVESDIWNNLDDEDTEYNTDENDGSDES